MVLYASIAMDFPLRSESSTVVDSTRPERFTPISHTTSNGGLCVDGVDEHSEEDRHEVDHERDGCIEHVDKQSPANRRVNTMARISARFLESLKSMTACTTYVR